MTAHVDWLAIHAQGAPGGFALWTREQKDAYMAGMIEAHTHERPELRDPTEETDADRERDNQEAFRYSEAWEAESDA